ncbi:MAG: LytTR family transcriptional regulator [Clostridiales bacterium]|nr:LytTR family transcriptional regulator [Clostridiales bacterium]
MKLKVMLSSEDPIMEELRKLNIEIDDRSEYVLTRREMDLNYLPAKNGEQTFYISIDDIIFIESLGHDVMLHTKDGVYVTKERLKTLERMLDPDDFLRVSNSSIVSIKNIRRIEASILQKFILHMSNGDKVDVTRSYYYIFKDRFNI